jgi:hypothetical protein
VKNGIADKKTIIIFIAINQFVTIQVCAAEIKKTRVIHNGGIVFEIFNR